MYTLNEEGYVLCPYDRSHVVPKLRIQSHIARCQKRNPDIKLATCFYNFTHRLKPEDMLSHYEVCPYKARVEEAKYINLDRFIRKSTDDSFDGYLSPSNSRSQSASSVNSIDDSKKLLGWLESFHISDARNSEKGNKSLEKGFASNSTTNSSLSSSSYTDEIFEPLPLPKTVSKAFNFNKSSNSSSSSLELENLDRRRRKLSKCDSKKPINGDQLLSNIESTGNDLAKDSLPTVKNNLSQD